MSQVARRSPARQRRLRCWRWWFSLSRTFLFKVLWNHFLWKFLFLWSQWETTLFVPQIICRLPSLSGGSERSRAYERNIKRERNWASLVAESIKVADYVARCHFLQKVFREILSQIPSLKPSKFNTIDFFGSHSLGTALLWRIDARLDSPLFISLSLCTYLKPWPRLNWQTKSRKYKQ